jgi:hypothetical protein
MDIPFDALLTLLIFLVGIPALILQLISPTERHAVLKNGRLDVRSFLKRALIFIAGGILVQLLLFILPIRNEDMLQLLRQLAWVILFVFLFALALDIAQKIPEQYGRREKIVDTLRRDVLNELPKRKRLNVSGETFSDLANLGKHCEAGQERGMVAQAFMEIVNATLADSRYTGDSFETLIEELVHMLAFNPEAKDLYNYRTALDILCTVLAANHSAETDNDKRRAVHAISHLGRTLIVNFKSVERDNAILAYVDSLEFALSKPNMFTEVSQALFEIGICAAQTEHDFVAVAALDKLTSLAERQSPPLPVEFVADMFGLLAHYWGMDGSRKEYAIHKFEETKKFLGKNRIQILKKAQSHLVSTMYFDEADKLGEMIGKLKRIGN